MLSIGFVWLVDPGDLRISPLIVARASLVDFAVCVALPALRVSKFEVLAFAVRFPCFVFRSSFSFLGRSLRPMCSGDLLGTLSSVYPFGE